MYDIHRLGANEARPDFDCGDDDLNEFFRVDSILGSQHLLTVTNTILSNGETIAFYSVSNDSIKREACPRSSFERLIKHIPRSKRYDSMPSVKIGRLGVIGSHQSSGVGTWILDIIKLSFSSDTNKTGCRFVVVDAYNDDKTINFYQKNGFDFLTTKDKNNDTRIMYFDLKPFKK